ncbi:PadR family transcriptional regulator [Paraclostridium sp. AKS73]|nr:PadR family transcriptional regulator [Paraclostridium sp. AKS73]
MYLALKRMESKKLVESYWGNEQSSGGKRKYYNLTNEGYEFLKVKKQSGNLLKRL